MLAVHVPRYALAVFALALAVRLGFVVVVDQPLLYTHQYTYFTNALRIVEHPDPVRYVLFDDEWRTWNGHWTIAPLYYLFLAAVFALLGPHLVWVQLAQCILGALSAVLAAALGRTLAGRVGTLAGLAYAVFWPAVERPSWTLTENLHIPLFLAALLALTREVTSKAPGWALAAGTLLGLAALTRSVTTVFIGAVAAALLWQDGRQAWRRVLPLLAGACAVILPWTARNVLLVREPVLIETTAFENFWHANHFVDAERRQRQDRIIQSQATSAGKRATALHFGLRGIRRDPQLVLEKVRRNFWHLLRPEGLHYLLRAERSFPAWRHATSVVLEDLLLLAGLVLFVVFLFAGPARHGPPAAVWWIVTGWTAYYLFMLLVVFHVEVRYRSPLVPLLFVGAAGGLALLRREEPVPGRRVLAGALAGAALVTFVVWPYVPLAGRAAASWAATRTAVAAARAGDRERALQEAAVAAALHPGSARPWLDVGRAFAHAGRKPDAVASYVAGLDSITQVNLRAYVALPRLLDRAGRPDEAAAALRLLHRLSWDVDPWLVLENAWSELPAPATNQIRVGADDYGAVRGFLHPRGLDPSLHRHRREWNRYDGDEQPPPGHHRWSRRLAWIRLRPLQQAPSYEVDVVVGTPFPSPLSSARVLVEANGAKAELEVTRELRTYRLHVPARPDGHLRIRLQAPTWNRAGEPADQGVRVDAVRVSPALVPAVARSG